MALITEAFYTARYGSGDTAQIEGLIDDASALVVDYVSSLGFSSATTVDPDTWDETTTPAAIQGIVAQIISRTLFNPLGLTGENLGDHGWQNNPRSSLGVMLAPSEKRAIRRAVGLPVGGTVDLDSYLPLPNEYDDTADELI